MAENRRDKAKRFYFTKGQMVLLGGAFTLAAVVIFALGMFVGKEIEARKMVKSEEPLVKVPVKPSPQGSGGTEGAKSKDDLTFYNTLTKTPTAKPEAETETAGKSKEETPKAAESQKKAQTREESAAQEKKSGEAASKAEAANAREGKPDGKTWSVQVNAYPDEKSARVLVERLKEKGYSAYLTDVNVKGEQWYRVRVGRFASRDEAEKNEQALKSKEGFSKAFLTRK